MITNNTMISVLAFVLFSTLLVGFYSLLAGSGDVLSTAQAGITELTFATTYMELAQGLAFDENTDSTYILPEDIAMLTDPNALGADTSTETDFTNFNDFDDLNGYEIVDTTHRGVSGTYKTHFDVHYVNSTDFNQILSSRTFVKRLDLWVLRIVPESKDTLRCSMVLGYFHFD